MLVISLFFEVFFCFQHFLTSDNYFLERIIWIEINGIVNRSSTKFDEKIHKTQGALMLLVSAYTGNLDLIPPRSFGRDPPSMLLVAHKVHKLYSSTQIYAGSGIPIPDPRSSELQSLESSVCDCFDDQQIQIQE